MTVSNRIRPWPRQFYDAEFKEWGAKACRKNAYRWGAVFNIRLDKIIATQKKEWAKLTADPVYEATKRLWAAAAERKRVSRGEPTSGTKKYGAWYEERGVAWDKDSAAYARLSKTIPTTAYGAILAIDAFLDHSLSTEIIKQYPEAQDLLTSIRAFLRTTTAAKA